MQDAFSLLALNPLHLPNAPSWFPLAWGWWLSLLLAVFFILLCTSLILWRRKRLIPKKTALLLLTSKQSQHTPSSAIELLRQVAFCYFSRDQIAHLTGLAWYNFLDEQLGRPLFVPNETQWQRSLYQKNTRENSLDPNSVTEAFALIQDCHLWVSEALPPKKRRKGSA